LLPGLGQRRAPVVRDGHLVPGGQQVVPEHLGLPFVVLRDQHMRTHDGTIGAPVDRRRDPDRFLITSLPP
jgi:hypothetical protein